MFLTNTEKYTINKKLPNTLPSIDTKPVVNFPDGFELRGYCPVTLYDDTTHSFEGIRAGFPHLIVSYDGKRYTFTCKENLERFMKSPWTFCNLQLPSKLPPIKVLDISIPVLEYLEKTVAGIVHLAMVNLYFLIDRFKLEEFDQNFHS